MKTAKYKRGLNSVAGYCNGRILEFKCKIAYRDEDAVLTLRGVMLYRLSAACVMRYLELLDDIF